MARLSGADYLQAFQNPRSAFTDIELQRATPAKSRLGLPMIMSGNFAVVCHFFGDNDTWAVRAFLHDSPDSRERYRLISSYLEPRVSTNSAIVGFRYIPDGIRVNGQLGPIVIMDWVTGTHLDAAVEALIQARQSLVPLINAWEQVVAELESLGIAHGDLQHGNILVDGTNIRLVDYDGMFVPGMDGMVATEHGHPNYQHPKRSSQPFDEHIDHFSAMLILTALKALDHDPSLWARYEMRADAMLFRRNEDLLQPDSSPLFEDLRTSGDAEVRQLADALRECVVSGSRVDWPFSSSRVRAGVISSTTDTTGWWKSAESDHRQVKDTPRQSPNQRPSTGSGWVRAYIGAGAADPGASDTRDLQWTEAKLDDSSGELLDQAVYVASFSRSYFHISSCDRAHKITRRNLIAFETLEEAFACGYKPCNICKPHQLRHVLPIPLDGSDIRNDDDSDPPIESKRWDVAKVQRALHSGLDTQADQPSRNIHNNIRVSIGSQVMVQYNSGRKALVHIVRRNVSPRTFSHVAENSALGRALLGKYPGDTVTYREVGKDFTLKILEVM